ncbi:MAG: type II secretion system protein [Planctomycetota bacterium]|nr:type II secretion system protein [Planctomycetota bacterium]
MRSLIHRGFTIIELLVVISIIAILIGLMYPALASVRKSAKKTTELNLISQVSKAWAMYSIDHQEQLLPGYLSTTVQQYRKLAWAFPDESIINPAPSYNPDLSNDAGPWTWRLLQYLDNDWESLLYYRNIDWDVSGGKLRDHADAIALQPAFGYNGYYLGGWWETDLHSGDPTVKFGSVLLSDNRSASVVTKTASHIKKPSNQIVFCSTFLASEGVHGHIEDDIAGSHFAIPSILARVVKWELIGDGLIQSRSESHTPLGRFNGMPVIAYADGHVNSVKLPELIDQQLWIPKAQAIDDIPASEFSHTQ